MFTSKALKLAIRRVSPSSSSARSLSTSFNLNITDEQKAFQELARSFARDEMMPKSAEYDESGKFPGSPDSQERIRY